MKRLIGIVSLVVAAGCAGPRAPEAETRVARSALTTPRYKMIDLGTLSGDTVSEALALNEHTQVVGSSSRTGVRRCVLWDAGNIVDLGGFGGNDCTARDINEAGQIVGDVRLGASNEVHAFLHESNAMADLGTLDTGFSRAQKINDAGQIAGRLGSTGGGCFFYAAGTMTRIGPGLSGDGAHCVVEDLNNLGHFVGEAAASAGLARPIIYDGATLVDLGSLISEGGGRALSINDDDVIVGYSLGPDGWVHAFRYESGVMADIANAVGYGAEGVSIDGAGRIVVLFESAVKGEPSYRVLWENGTLRDLRPFEPHESNTAGHVAGVADDRAAVYRDGTVIDLGADAPSRALHVNEAGAIIGWAPFLNATTGDTERHATLWLPLASDGAPCADPSECSSDVCFDGICCDEACDGVCQACTVAKGAASDGTCTFLDSTHTCRAGSGNICDMGGHCTGSDPDCPLTNTPAPSDTNCYTRPEGALCAALEAELPCGGNLTCPAPTPRAAQSCGAPDDSNMVSLPAAGVTVQFPDDSWSGSLAVVQAHGCPPADGFEFVPEEDGQGYYWQIVAEPPITGLTMQICFTYQQEWFEGSTGMEPFIFISHGHASARDPDNGTCDPAGAGWQNLPHSEPVDPDGNVVCSQVDSFSPFALVVPTRPVFISQPGTIVAYATSTAGARVTYPQPVAIDRRDGARPVACSPASGSRFPPGQTTVICTAPDSSGNTSTTTFTVVVTYEAPTNGTFFQQPINPDGSSIFKLGSTVPVRFKLTGASAAITNLAAHLTVAKLSSSVTGTYAEATSPGAANTDDTFRCDPATGQYIFNLATKTLSKGTWSLRVDLGDGVEHVVRVSLR